MTGAVYVVTATIDPSWTTGQYKKMWGVKLDRPHETSLICYTNHPNRRGLVVMPFSDKLWCDL